MNSVVMTTQRDYTTEYRVPEFHSSCLNWPPPPLLSSASKCESPPCTSVLGGGGHTRLWGWYSI